MTCMEKDSEDFIVEKDGSLFYMIKRRMKEKEEALRPRFTSFVQKDLPSCDREQYSKLVDGSCIRTSTFLVFNSGLHPVVCQLEMSPDGTSWESFGELEITIYPGQKQVIAPQFFLRYVRIKFRNAKEGFESQVTIWFQGQD